MRHDAVPRERCEDGTRAECASQESLQHPLVGFAGVNALAAGFPHDVCIFEEEDISGAVEKAGETVFPDLIAVGLNCYMLAGPFLQVRIHKQG